MRRADRLFRLVQLLRRPRVSTAAGLARQLEVSERTIYRDIQDLVTSGVPVQGEAGVGYALPRGFDLPPLMFTDDELEALALGARIVSSWTDPSLAKAAEVVLEKIEAVLPERLKSRFEQTVMFAVKRPIPAAVLAHLAEARSAIGERRKMRIRYTTPDEAVTARTIQPIGLFFWGSMWTIVAWCELRADFRSFRLDRLEAVEILAQTFEPEPGRTLEDFLQLVATVREQRNGTSGR